MYAIELAPEFAKQTGELHPKRYKQIHLRVFALQINPRPPDCVMLDTEYYFVRVGPYFVFYRVNDEQHRVRVILLTEQEEFDQREDE